tara:strand:+ start:4162 stop:4380 length:219 start_codon:yes stop_codon:yes gene_type:complete
MYNSPSQTREVNRILNEKEKKPKKKTEAQIFQKKKKTHRMPDGTIMSGAKHTAYSKVVKKKNKKKMRTYNKK